MPEEPNIAQRLFETVAQGLNRLVTASDVPNAIQQFLSTLGEAAQVDRVYVFEQHPDPQTGRALVSQRFEWTAPGIAPQFDNPDLQNFPVEDALPRWFRTISRGDVVRGWVRDLPPEERAILEPQGILSILVVPILQDTLCWGFVGFDDCTRGRVWADAEALLLKAAAGALGSALLRARAELALRESEQRLRLVLEGSGQGFWDWDIPTGRVVFDDTWATMLGYQIGEIVPHVSAWEVLVHPEDMIAVRNALVGHIEGRTPAYECEHRLRCKNGDWKWVLDRGKVVRRDAAGGAVRACGTHTDISERRRVAAALRETEANNRAILHAIPDQLFRLDRNGRFVDVLANRQEHFAHSVDQVLGRNIAELAPPEFATAFLAHVARTLDTHVVQVWEYEWPRPPGTENFEARFVALNSDEVLVLSRNITERKRAASEVLRTLARERELSGLKSTFVSVVSHEFRTPLGAILGATEMLEDFYDRLSAEKRKNYFHIIRQEVRRLTAMVGDMLLQGQLDAGRLRCQPTTLDLPKLVHRVLAEIEAAFPKHPPIQVHIAETASQVRADDALLGHMLRNLLSNACKYSPQLTPVALTVNRTGDNVEIAVQDHGIGIPDADLDTIFSPFRRGANVAHIKGTGVGLYILRKCAELHGGQVSVQSQVGQGSTFRLALPADPQPTPSAPSAYAHAPDR